MKMPFFASFIIFIIWLAYEISKARHKHEKTKLSFWERENKANQTRRKPLDHLPYVTIPFDKLPVHVLPDNEKIREYVETLHYLAEQPIVNFTGYSNTDLKLEYGAPNIQLLTRYDQNYTLMVRTLQQWADVLYKAGYVNEARCILEFALSTNTDVSATYRLLAQIYQKEGRTDNIREMIAAASTLRSASKNAIVRSLQEFCQ